MEISGQDWLIRVTGKVVLTNSANHIALIGNKVNNIFLLPGGGIEKNESIIDGIKRECREETGFGVEIENCLGVSEDFRLRDLKHCISFGYSAKIINKGLTNYTHSEIGIGIYVKWFSLEDAMALFTIQEEKVRAGEVNFYNTSFNIIRDAIFIRRYLNL